VVPPDLHCFEASNKKIKGTVINAYSIFVPDKDVSLTKAGCVVAKVSISIQAVTYKLNHVLTPFIQITKKKLLAPRL